MKIQIHLIKVLNGTEKNQVKKFSKLLYLNVVLVSGDELHKRSSRISLTRSGTSGLESCAEDVRLKEVGQEGVNLALYVAFLDAVSLIAVPKFKNNTITILILDKSPLLKKMQI